MTVHSENYTICTSMNIGHNDSELRKGPQGVHAVKGLTIVQS